MKITYTNVEPLLEGFRQLARVVVLGIIPIIISGINTSTGVITINWNVIGASALAILLTAVLSGIDKDRHLQGKLEDDETKKLGLTLF